VLLNCQHRVRVSPARLGRFLGRVSRTLGARQDAFAVCLVSDAAIARLNRKYRGKRGSTDVLSFPAVGADIGPEDGTGGAPRDGHSLPAHLGDIAISPETAQRQARREGRPLELELRTLILHGVLHLLGFDHETDHGEMERFERRLRRRLGLA
jgi:probable rRNA maturation factor